MGALSNKINRDELKAGDHTYSWRNAYIYAHHGNPCPQCADTKGLMVSSYPVSTVFFTVVSSTSSSMMSQWLSFLPNLEEGLAPLQIPTLIYRANFLLQNGFGVYHVFKNSCEDFVIYCKTDLLVITSISVGHSGQAASLVAPVSSIVSSPLRCLTASFIGLAAVGYGMYCVSRLVSDIGVQRDVAKVQVEELIAHPR